MTIHYLVKMWHSSSHNHIRQNIVKAYKNPRDLDNYIANDKDIKLTVPPNVANYYKKETATVDNNCTKLYFLLYRNNFDYFQEPQVFSNEDAAILSKAKFEYARIESNSKYIINSDYQLKNIPIE